MLPGPRPFVALRLVPLLGLVLALAGARPHAVRGQQVPPTDSVVQDTLLQDSVTQDSAAADSLPPEPEELTSDREESDEEIRQQLQALFDRVAALSGIRVEVEAGIVRLRGTVSEAQAAERAGELARSPEGVLYVEDEIRLTTSVADRLEPTWIRLRDLGLDAVAFLPLAVVALFVVFLSVLLGKLLGRWGGPSFLQSRNPFLRQLVARLIQLVVVALGIVVALEIVEATALVGAVVGTAGLAGLAVGFAFKDIVENYLAGFFMAVRQPFAQNDHVVVENFEGKVVRLTPRETILMTLDGNHIRLPNALVFGKPLLNYTRNPRRRFQFDVGVGTGDDLAEAREVGMRTLRSMEGVMDEPAPEAIVLDLGESWVSLRFLGWVDQEKAEYMRVRSEAVRLVKLELENAGISLPSPEYLVRLQGEGGVPMPATGGPPEARTPSPESRRQGDVSRDDTVDRQIEEDRRASDEENLLADGPRDQP